VYDGRRCLAARRVPVALGSDAATWIKDVRKLGAVLGQVVEELGATSLPATVFYRSPTEAVDLASFAVRWPWQACEAARLACTDSLPYPAEAAVCEASVVGRDRPPVGGGGTPGPRQQHALVAAERNDVAWAIVEMVNEAGLDFDMCAPLSSAVSAKLATELLAAVGGPAVGGLPSSDSSEFQVPDSEFPASEQPHSVLGTRNSVLTPAVAMLYIAEHCSSFVLGTDGALTFSRQMSLGVESLVTALTRPLRVDAAGSGLAAQAEHVTLDPETARRLLHEHGLPERTKILEPSLGIRGHHVYPVLQPVLQRYVVELRQSLRFGGAGNSVFAVDAPSTQRSQRDAMNGGSAAANVSPSARSAAPKSDLRIICMGPGSAIPGFAQLLSEELGVPVEADARYVGYRYDEPGADGSSLADAAADSRLASRVNLQPIQLAHDRRMKRIRRWLWTGAAAAILVLAVDALRYAGRVDQARKQANALVSRAGDMETLRATGERLFTAVTAMNQLETAIEQELSRRADFHAVMQELSRIVPEPVALTRVSIRREEDRLLATINGFAFYLDSHQQTTSLAPFIARLRESPLIEWAALGNVSTGTLGQSGGERFDATLTLAIVPASGVQRGAVSASGNALLDATGGRP
jgi:Tfp pilus assembly protein PilN